jgi:hypothetical protein
MKKIVLLAIAMLMLSGCTSTFQAPPVCEDGQSVILKVTQGNPTGLDRALLIVQVGVHETHAYPVAEVATFLDEVENVIDNGVTYVDLLSYLDIHIAELQKTLGIAAVVMGPEMIDIATIGGDDLISDCDLALMKIHLERQRQILAIYSL